MAQRLAVLVRCGQFAPEYIVKRATPAAFKTGANLINTCKGSKRSRVKSEETSYLLRGKEGERDTPASQAFSWGHFLHVYPLAQGGRLRELYRLRQTPRHKL